MLKSFLFKGDFSHLNIEECDVHLAFKKEKTFIIEKCCNLMLNSIKKSKNCSNCFSFLLNFPLKFSCIRCFYSFLLGLILFPNKTAYDDRFIELSNHSLNLLHHTLSIILLDLFNYTWMSTNIIKLEPLVISLHQNFWIKNLIIFVLSYFLQSQ
jgi:hypothetical protein